MSRRTVSAIVVGLALDNVLLQDLGHLVRVGNLLLCIFAVGLEIPASIKIISCLSPSGRQDGEIACSSKVSRGKLSYILGAPGVIVPWKASRVARRMFL